MVWWLVAFSFSVNVFRVADVAVMATPLAVIVPLFLFRVPALNPVVTEVIEAVQVVPASTVNVRVEPLTAVETWLAPGCVYFSVTVWLEPGFTVKLYDFRVGVLAVMSMLLTVSMLFELLPLFIFNVGVAQMLVGFPAAVAVIFVPYGNHFAPELHVESNVLFPSYALTVRDALVTAVMVTL